MSKDDLIDLHGVVVAVHSGGLYRVKIDAGHEMLAQLSGRMRRFHIKVVPGDRVTVGVSPYDPLRGFITFRARYARWLYRTSPTRNGNSVRITPLKGSVGSALAAPSSGQARPNWISSGRAGLRDM